MKTKEWIAIEMDSKAKDKETEQGQEVKKDTREARRDEQSAYDITKPEKTRK